MRVSPTSVKLLLVAATLIAVVVGSAATSPSWPVVAEPAPTGQPPLAPQAVTATVWITEVITSGAEIYFRNDALQLDGNDVPSLAFQRSTPGAPTESLHYARQVGTTWEIETVSPATEASVSTPALALDPQYQPHVSYAISGTIYHARKVGGAWQAEAINAGQPASWSSAIAVSKSGTVAVAYASGYRPSYLHYAESNGNGWTVAKIVTSTVSPMGEYASLGGRLAIGFDGNGRPHINYEQSTSAPRPFAYVSQVAKRDGKWDTTGVGGDSYLYAHALKMVDTLGGYSAYSSLGPHCIIPCPMFYRTEIYKFDGNGIRGLPIATFSSGNGSMLSLSAYNGEAQITYDSVLEVPGPTRPVALTKLERIRVTDPVDVSDFIALGNLRDAALAVTSRGQPMVVFCDVSAQQLLMTKPVQVTYAHGVFLPAVFTNFQMEAPDE